MAATYIAAILVIIFKCFPMNKQWQIYPDPGSQSSIRHLLRILLMVQSDNCQPGFSRLQVSFIMAINTLTDLYLMAIPLPVSTCRTTIQQTQQLTYSQMIYRSRLPTRKKVSLLILFSGGFLVIAFGVLRCVSLLTVSFPSTSPQLSPMTTLQLSTSVPYD